MVRAPEDRLFERYLSRGDQRALAALFDRVAPELWRVATYLTRGSAARMRAAVEERFLYAPLLMVDAGLLASRHALAEHHEAQELVEVLKVRDKTSAAWLTKARELTTWCATTSRKRSRGSSSSRVGC